MSKFDKCLCGHRRSEHWKISHENYTGKFESGCDYGLRKFCECSGFVGTGGEMFFRKFKISFDRICGKTEKKASGKGGDLKRAGTGDRMIPQKKRA